MKFTVFCSWSWLTCSHLKQIWPSQHFSPNILKWKVSPYLYHAVCREVIDSISCLNFHTFCLVDWPKNHHFKIFKLEIENIFLIDWFGGPKPISPSQYLEFGRWACKTLKRSELILCICSSTSQFVVLHCCRTILFNIYSIYAGIRNQWCHHKQRMLHGSVSSLWLLKMKCIPYIM